MEKIYQTTYRIPVPDETGIEGFVRQCARDSGIHALINVDLVSLIADRCGRNPRRIKKLINGFVLEVGLNRLWRDFGPQAADSAIRTLLLQHLYPDFYRMLVGSGTAYGDVLTEFRTYRQVRRTLRGVSDGAAGDADLTRFFAQYEVRPPTRENPGRWGEALAELESQLPSVFPALAADRGFTSLVEDLVEQPQSAELIQRLRQQPTHSTEPAETQAIPYPDPPESHVEQPLRNMRILWIDDDPESVKLDTQAMRRAGASVAIAKDRAEAQQHLAAEGRDLLISDITRGTDHEAGFADVERLRNDGSYSGPVIFYTGRVTPSREARARELQALGITASPRQLQQLVVTAALSLRYG
jgi:CheY-like chemotaxis protein